MTDRPRQIAKAIIAAIVAQALPPGTKLGERELAEVWGTSRAVIKQALIIVGESGLVDTRMNRGASVAQLGQREAYELFEALSAVEQGVAFQLMQRLSGREWEVMAANVDEVDAAIDLGDNVHADDIGPIFHDHLLALSGNRALQEVHARLVRRMQLLRQLYVNRDYHRCRLNDDHRDLLDHMRAGRVTEALSLIQNHYQSIARGYDVEAPVAEPASLKEALAPWLETETAPA
ncbi:transcriptional regulator, GntR family [Pseudooceanicola antarcticus]|uniref:GntR family transcriptional regulator n=1 Tax=Pseudooceanicola antarcticus TaxID=1247613 RepID=A0A285JEH8_9RHOB|nr:GntR family transcriptional regulator [Pseudooceanicola antarcticus]PJE31075.1 GntR family transcriptional regulator [Pseudooceanicola antarcticus]SNY58668.1 transcriptional regulator, GntR family [Pseudooceanicola antarcticus]